MPPSTIVVGAGDPAPSDPSSKRLSRESPRRDSRGRRRPQDGTDVTRAVLEDAAHQNLPAIRGNSEPPALQSRARSRSVKKVRENTSKGTPRGNQDDKSAASAAKLANKHPGLPRAASEPPPKRQGGGPKGRLALLIEEVTEHLRYAEDPADIPGWLSENAQVELFADELRWLISDHEGRAPARQREISVLRGDKDLHWAKQQLKYCEKEYGHLVQMLNARDPDLQAKQAAELKHITEESDAEQRRQRQVALESRQREHSLARAAKDGCEIEGDARAMQQIERLEAERSVWHVKNSSLQKQIMQEEAELSRAKENCQVLSEKARSVAERLESDDQQVWLAERRAMDARLHNEESALEARIAELQEARRRTTKAFDRKRRDKSKQISELEKQREDMEAKKADLKHEESTKKKQLRRQQRAASAQTSPRTSPQISPRSPRGSPRTGACAAYSSEGESLRGISMPSPQKRHQTAQSPRCVATSEDGILASGTVVNSTAHQESTMKVPPSLPRDTAAQEEAAAREHAAMEIQRRYRGSRIRNHTDELRRNKEEATAASAIQRHMRTNLAARHQRDEQERRMKEKQAAALDIQRRFRGSQQRRENVRVQRAAIQIQRRARGRFARSSVASEALVPAVACAEPDVSPENRQPPVACRDDVARATPPLAKARLERAAPKPRNAAINAKRPPPRGPRK